jgi:hypothetical protein
MRKAFLEVDDKQLENAERMLLDIPGGTGKAVYYALTRAIQNARSNLVNEARKSYTVKAKSVRSTLKIKRVTKKNLFGEVRSTGRVIPMIDFKVNPKTVNPRRSAPIRVGVRKGTSSPLASAFIARIDGKVGVFERVGPNRAPLRQIFGPSAPQMVGNEDVIKRVSDEAVEVLQRRLDHEIQNILAGRY